MARVDMLEHALLWSRICAAGTLFFTVNLLERRRRFLIEHVDDLRASFLAAWLAQPFEVIAIVVLPEHLHCVWRLPEGDSDNAGRWGRIRSGFCRRLQSGEYRSNVRIARREQGIWQRRFRERPLGDGVALPWCVDDCRKISRPAVTP